MDTPKKSVLDRIWVWGFIIAMIIMALVNRATRKPGDAIEPLPNNPTARRIMGTIDPESKNPRPGKFDWDKWRERNKDRER